MKPKHLTDGVWLVGSGTDDDVLTDPHDCHTYLLWDGRSGFVVDCGTGLGFDRWAESVAQLCDPLSLQGCLVTHYHADHAGGAARLRDLGIAVFASPETVAALAHGDEECTQVRAARQAGIYPDTYRLRAADLQAIPETLTLGAFTVRTVQTPGHCDGHLVFVASIGSKQVLFSGDCLFAGGLVSMQAIPDCRLDRYAASVIELARRHVDVLLPGHGDLVLSTASEHVRRAARSFSHLIPPPNFLHAERPPAASAQPDTHRDR